jgi:RimJ/RimL family protein N-acetyltransferase
MTSQSLLDIWPLLGLRVTTPRLTLAYPTDEHSAELAEVAKRGIHAEGISPFMTGFSLLPPDERARSVVQFQWKGRAEFSVEKWTLPFVAIVDGEVVGVQDAFTSHFALTRAVTTGSWLVADRQGEGIGTEMRRAILHLLFDGLGAEIAHTEAFAHNGSSQGVTRKLGYIDDGETIGKRGDGEAERSLRFRMEREHWAEVKSDDLTIHGLEACLPLFGL